MAPEELTTIKAGAETALEAVHRGWPWPEIDNDLIIGAALKGVPALVAEVERLTALLAPLVAVMPDTDTGACAYCNDTDAPEGRHAADCPWWSARTGAART
jgi:hypothetical protein